MLKEFMTFLKSYGVIGLAIAVVIGGKLNELISSLVNDLVMPLVLQPLLNSARVSHIKELNYNGILYGKVIGTGIEFMIVAFSIFLFAKFILKEEIVTKK